MKEENVLVCVTGQLSCERLIHAGAQIARKTGGSLCVLHVARKGNRVLNHANEAEALEYLFNVSVANGAEMQVVRSDDVQGTIVSKLREQKAGTLVAGRSAKYSGWDMLDELKLLVPEVEFEIQ